MPEALFCIIFMFLNVGITAYIIVRCPCFFSISQSRNIYPIAFM